MAGKSLNRVQLIGNLGKDPEIKYTPSGAAVAKITIATNERFKDKSGEWQDRTEWHNVVLWQRLAEIAGEYLKKGGKVYIEGRLQTRSWDDKQTGQKKYATDIVASDLILLGGRGEGGGGGDFSSRSNNNNFDQRVPEPEPAGASPIRSSRSHQGHIHLWPTILLEGEFYETSGLLRAPLLHSFDRSCSSRQKAPET
jgi:single-strand DNA-binding protein